MSRVITSDVEKWNRVARARRPFAFAKTGVALTSLGPSGAGYLCRASLTRRSGSGILQTHYLH